MKTILKIVAVLVLSLSLAGSIHAQAVLSSTTLGAAITSTSVSQNIILGSLTGITAANPQTDLWVDGELMVVTATQSGPVTVSVIRGAAGTRPSTHLSGATVYFATPAQFTAFPRNGSCTNGNEGDTAPPPLEAILPLINYRDREVYQCISNQWKRAEIADFYNLTLVGSVGLKQGTPSAGGVGISATGGVGGAQSATTGNGAVGGANSSIGGAGGAGGSSSGTGGTGGSITGTGGAGGGTVTGGVGGALIYTGGAGGGGTTANGVGGAASLVGGAAGATGAGTGAIGGAANVTGGAGTAVTASGGTGGAGGVTTIAAGVGGAASTGAATGGAGGALALNGGAGGGTITGGVGGAVTLAAGAGANGSTAGGTGGALTLSSGAAGSGGTGTVGAISLKSGTTAVLAATTAGAVTLNSSGTNQTLTLNGSGSGKVTIADGTDTTKTLVINPAGATASTATTFNFSQTAARTLTAPDFTGGLPLVLDCGSTGTGNQTCTAAAATVLTKIITGHSTLSSNAAVITFPSSLAFTSSTSYECVADDITTRANPVQMLTTSSTTATITNTTGGSDVISWMCIGN